MALPNDKRSLQDRLSRVATRMAQKFGNRTFTGVTAGTGAGSGSTGGYAYLGELMINRCLRYVSSIG